MAKAKKAEVIAKFQRAEKDTGSSEVQIALLTSRIQHLTKHMKACPKDKHSELGLIKLVSQRRSLLKYLKKTSPEVYRKLIKDLKLRG